MAEITILNAYLNAHLTNKKYWCNLCHISTYSIYKIKTEKEQDVCFTCLSSLLTAKESFEIKEDTHD